ncbi:hypothetical protein FOMPIDRAFT_99635 [Fomitopsis schrenkii]|uniref:F-box domain-containing protein n=1 Tax=Fomitopsis schrenkii TaxID=2126942 RepID=S8FLT1_FOMSC|nr:hypothetical protein FOMPIDRAFT_99635 [Fomitopsis schrenkii]
MSVVDTNIGMLTHRATPRIPPELVDIILAQLSPSQYAAGLSKERREVTTALSRCARACRTFHFPALKVLWRDQELLHACSVLPTLMEHRVKSDPHAIDFDDDDDENGNEDWFVENGFDGYDHGHQYKCYFYLPGPLSQEAFSRFEYYARLIHTLRHPRMIHTTWDPSVFMFLQQAALGRQLFPNVRELVWHYATSDLVTVVSPQIRILRLACGPYIDDDDDYANTEEAAFRARRHAIKSLIPGVLHMLPELEELTMRLLGHEDFWKLLAPAPNHSFIAQNIRRIEISEPRAALMRAALPAVSTIPQLTELKITLAGERSDNTFFSPERRTWDKATIHPFARLHRLRIHANPTAMVAILDAIDAPELAEIELCQRTVEEPIRITQLFHDIIRTLCDGHTDTLRRVQLVFQGVKTARFLSHIQPLFTLHQLRDLDLFVKTDGALKDMPLADMVASWPALERLAILTAVLTPDALARACPGLQSLTALRLSSVDPSTGKFSLATPASQPRESGRKASRRAAPKSVGDDSITGHALRELRLDKPVRIAQANVSKLARFLDELFPQLQVERLHVLGEVGKLQDARRT